MHRLLLMLCIVESRSMGHWYQLLCMHRLLLMLCIVEWRSIGHWYHKHGWPYWKVMKGHVTLRWGRHSFVFKSYMVKLNWNTFVCLHRCVNTSRDCHLFEFPVWCYCVCWLIDIYIAYRYHTTIPYYCIIQGRLNFTNGDHWITCFSMIKMGDPLTIVIDCLIQTYIHNTTC